MDDLPTISGRKRVLSDGDDEILTPKKARAAQMPPTPTSAKSKPTRLPSHLQHVLAAYVAIEEALIPALASNGVAAPTADRMRNGCMNILHVLTHLSVPGLSLDNLKRLVYLLEWEDSLEVLPKRPAALPVGGDPDDPFLVPAAGPFTTDWTRGGHGLVVSQTTHLNRSTGRRSAAYAIGIQIESDATPKGKGRVGMNTVTRWLEKGSERKAIVEQKLQRWVQIHRKAAREPALSNAQRSTSPSPVQIPSIHMALLPDLTPSSTLTSPVKSPLKRSSIQSAALITPKKSSVPFPTPDQTPETSLGSGSGPSTPQKDRDSRTPSTARRDALRERIRQRSVQANGSPTKGTVTVTLGTEKDGTPRQKLVGPEELKRRLILGRLENIAECVASLLSGSRVGSSSTSPYKRRIMRIEEVVRVVVKSARVPISDAEATEALELLMSLCPTFVSPKIIDRERWLEMPSAVIPAPVFGPSPVKEAPVPNSSIPSTPRKPKANISPPSPASPSLRGGTLASPSARRVPPSPGRMLPQSPGSRLTKEEIEEELLSRLPGEGSPRRVRPALVGRDGKELMTLRDVRERIRRELEQD